MITKKSILYGMAKRIVNIVPSPIDSEGLVCKIGETWFYFGGHTAEEYSDPEKYLHDMDIWEIVEDVYRVLCDYRCDEAYSEEYAYYESILDENGCLDQPFKENEDKMYMVYESDRCDNDSFRFIAAYDTLKDAADAIKKWSVNLGGDSELRNYGCEINRNGKIIRREVYVDNEHKLY